MGTTILVRRHLYIASTLLSSFDICLLFHFLKLSFNITHCFTNIKVYILFLGMKPILQSKQSQVNLVISINTAAQTYFMSTHFGREMHIYVSKPGHHWFRLMAWRPLGAKSLPEHMSAFIKLDHEKQNSAKY